MEVNLCNLGLGNDSWDTIPKAQGTKNKTKQDIVKLDFTKISKICGK